MLETLTVAGPAVEKLPEPELPVDVTLPLEVEGPADVIVPPDVDVPVDADAPLDAEAPVEEMIAAGALVSVGSGAGVLVAGRGVGAGLQAVASMARAINPVKTKEADFMCSPFPGGLNKPPPVNLRYSN